MKKWVKMAMGYTCGCLFLAGCEKTAVPEAAQEKEPVRGGSALSAAAEIMNLNDMDFKAQTAKGLVLVDFWAPWCGPCRMQGPIVDKVAVLLGNTVKIAKVNVDKAPQTAKAFGIRSIPTLIVLKDGQSIKQFQGVTQADDLVAAVKAAQ